MKQGFCYPEELPINEELFQTIELIRLIEQFPSHSASFHYTKPSQPTITGNWSFFFNVD
jgi:hypothetical protein